MVEYELYHHGVKGMKWGVRRYQNKDGSLTKAGKTRYKLGVEKSEYKKMTFKQRNQLAKNYYNNTPEGAESLKKITRNTTIATVLGGPIAGLAVGFATIKKIEDNVLPKSDDKSIAEGKKAADTAVKKIGSEPVSERVSASKIATGFKTDSWGQYSSELRTDIGKDKGVTLTVEATKGNETANASAAMKFLQKYDYNKAKEGVVKAHYDDDKYSWVGKNPGDDNYYSRNDFKNQIKLSYMNVDPDNNTYVAYWHGGDAYGGHFLVDEGSTNDMKVRYRSVEG